ncbi:MAG: NAD-dependent dihydropyrimidine dehydrogenase subunit PreA [Treponema sp.]|jgi:dihydropyrimidine dehydrogenase (NAD+) subunit PreA|nr:NAD-dependent dihydropyrimidine dehydrogenase subunit PreA [Treponema sp.]
MMRKADHFIDPIEEASRCLLCHDASCAAACPRRKKREETCDPAFFIRGIRFDLGASALESMEGCRVCKRCERACIHYDYPVRIMDVYNAVSFASAGIKRRGVTFRLGLTNDRYYRSRPKPLAADAGALTLSFCGVKCENPFFLSSSIVAANYEMCARALRAGWGGVVFKTIGYGEIRDVSPRFDSIGKERTPFVGFRNLEQISDRPAQDNFTDLKRLKEEFPSKVIIASIMGQNEGEWTALAKECEAAKVDLIECNFSCPHMSEEGLGSDVGQNPELVGAFTKAARKGSRLPILAKMTPNLGNMIPPAEAALAAGADGIAAINTVKSFTGFNSDTLRALLDVNGKTCVSGYSGKAVKPIALRFISDLKTWKGTMNAPVSGMGGIETWKDALDFLLLGCANLQITTAVMQYGYRIIDQLKLGLLGFMRHHHYLSLAELVGKGLGVFAAANELDRRSVQAAVLDREKCLGCGRCYLSCRDAGHGAVIWDARKRLPAIDRAACEGCHLCLYVCPSGALSAGARTERAK